MIVIGLEVDKRSVTTGSSSNSCASVRIDALVRRSIGGVIIDIGASPHCAEWEDEHPRETGREP
jgi:hypothetical protein